jgi:hypothetical protein
MALLDEIKKRASQFYQDVQNPHSGSWFGLPDFGLTEIIRPVYAAETTPTTDYGYDNRQTTWDPYTSIFNNPPSGQQTTQTTGLTTGTDIGRGDNGQNLAEQGLYSRLNSILNNLALYRQMGEEARNRARSVRDEVIGNITNTYQDLLTRAGQAKDSALETLGQEDLGVQNLYGRAAGTARRAIDSAITRNRMMARAMNRPDSSFYDDMQAKTRREGALSISKIAEEEAAKRAAIGTRVTDTSNWYENQVVDLGREEAQLKSQAEREYQDQVANADFQERAFGIDAIDAAERAQQEYQSRLDQINQYIQSKGMRLAEIAATSGNSRAVIDAFKAITPELSGTLGNRQALDASQSLIAGLGNQWNMGGGQGNNLAAFATFKPRSEEEEFREKMRYLFGY